MRLPRPSLLQYFVLSIVLAGTVIGVHRSSIAVTVREVRAQIFSSPFLVPASSLSSSSRSSSASSKSIYLEEIKFPELYYMSSSSSENSVFSVSSIDVLKDLPPFIAPVSSSVSSVASLSSNPSTALPLFPTSLPAEYYASSARVVFFSDISRVSPEGNAAYLLAERGIVSGFPDGTFRPDLPVNRAELTKLILLARNGEEDFGDIVYNGKFSDVAVREWYVPYVMVATQLGIISGYPDGTFKGGYIVNTAEFLKMISVAFRLDGGFSYTYQDVPPAAWYAKYASIATRFGLFPERPVLFLQPERYLTRGEVAYALSKILRLQ